MVAILHSIITDIENSRIQEQLNYWRWKSNIYHNKKDTITQMNLVFTAECEVMCSQNRDKKWYSTDTEEVLFMVLNYKKCYHCNGREENDYNCEYLLYSDKYVPRGQRLCRNCGYEPDRTDEFDKFGHNDDYSYQSITGTPPSIDEHLTPYKIQVNDMYLMFTLDSIKIGGVWIWLDQQALYKVIDNNGVRKFSANAENQALLADICSEEFMLTRFTLS